MKRFSFALAAGTLSLVCASTAGALTLSFANGVSQNPTSSIATCSSPFTNANYQDCVTTGFISDSLATNTDYFMNLDTFGGGGQGLGEESFASAFAAYETASGVDWTLQADQNNTLAGNTITVTNFTTASFGQVGGINNIRIELSGALTQSLIDQLVWIQGLEINYKPGVGAPAFSTQTNYNVMDDAAFSNFNCTAIPNGSPASVPAGTWCGPIYPFQYSDAHFFDAPMGPWPNGSFRGIAMLATIDTVNHVVTTYGGVSYGFDNSVATPEPGAWTLLLAGVGVIFLGRRRLMARG
jgi:MYXO-CTERM domain-containing protein